MNLKKSAKIILTLSVLVLLFLFYLVFKGVTGSTEVTDSTELNDSTKMAKELSYIKNQDKDYIIEEYSNKKGKQIKYIQRFVGESKGYNTWFGTETLLEKENKNGLFYGDVKVLAYPVEVGKTWTFDSYTFSIESVDKTIKTPAGTFKNVVEVKTIQKGVKGYTVTYFAKGVGQIKRESVDSNARTVRFELLELTKEE